MANICVGDRVQSLFPPTELLHEQNRMTIELMFREETESDKQISPSIFTEERIALQRKILLASVAGTWNLVLQQQTPDFVALEKLLDARYHNSGDDIPHLQLFGSSDS